ncbi:hypothetical protein OBBRIDRAFT_500090 [Obba rivulosa]|uniref:Uncharacterized protein n=1 Tax=Obba rivulosa TaxID=1052685 RepID=A0A8E2DTW7_9APHY|nr:hypothetical protein OBBRIDRAFT_500090 [Obba rivulosa]
MTPMREQKGHVIGISVDCPPPSLGSRAPFASTSSHTTVSGQTAAEIVSFLNGLQEPLLHLAVALHELGIRTGQALDVLCRTPEMWDAFIGKLQRDHEIKFADCVMIVDGLKMRRVGLQDAT